MKACEVGIKEKIIPMAHNGSGIRNTAKEKENIDIELCVSAEADEQWSFVQKEKINIGYG